MRALALSALALAPGAAVSVSENIIEAAQEVATTSGDAGLHLQEWLNAVKIRIPSAGNIFGFGFITGGECRSLDVHGLAISSSSTTNRPDNKTLSVGVHVDRYGLECTVMLKQDPAEGPNEFAMQLRFRNGSAALSMDVDNTPPMPGVDKLFPHEIKIPKCDIEPACDELVFTGKNKTFVEEMKKKVPLKKTKS